MLKGERAIITCKKSELCVDPRLGLENICSIEGRISITLELNEFNNGNPSWNMSDEEKLEYAMERKEVGGKLFKAGKYRLALERYKRVTESITQYYHVPKDGNELVTVCELNKAACMLKVGDNYGAKNACTAVLRVDPENVKALFRR